MAEIHKWHGFRELDQNLKMLGEQMREKGVKRMMSQAAVPMRDEATHRVPVLTGAVRAAIKIWRKNGTPYAVTYYVGVKVLSAKTRMRAVLKWYAARAKGGNPKPLPAGAAHWRLLELGTSKMRARPFLRPAFESKKMESVKAALDEGRAFVKRTVRRFKKTRKP